MGKMIVSAAAQSSIALHNYLEASNKTREVCLQYKQAITELKCSKWLRANNKSNIWLEEHDSALGYFIQLKAIKLLVNPVQGQHPHYTHIADAQR